MTQATPRHRDLPSARREQRRLDRAAGLCGLVRPAGRAARVRSRGVPALDPPEPWHGCPVQYGSPQYPHPLGPLHANVSAHGTPTVAPAIAASAPSRRRGSSDALRDRRRPTPLQPAPALEPKHPSEKPKAKGTRLPGAAPEMAAACRPSAPALARSLPPAHRRSRERQRGQAPATARDLRQARQSIRTRPVDESRRPRLGRRRTRPAVPRQIQSRPSRIGNPTARGRRTSRGTPAAARNLFGDQQPATLPTAATSKR